MIALETILDRCQALELRAAAAYRTFAATTRGQPEVCALWTELAREEEQHARSIATARAHLRQGARTRTTIEGWEETIGEVEDRLAVAERLGAGATMAEQLAAALDLEMTELEALRHVVLAAANAPEPDDQSQHAERLADAAETLTDDPQVRLQVALLRARTRLQHD
jgi:rubrerythrin